MSASPTYASPITKPIKQKQRERNWREEEGSGSLCVKKKRPKHFANQALERLPSLWRIVVAPCPTPQTNEVQCKSFKEKLNWKLSKLNLTITSSLININIYTHFTKYKNNQENYNKYKKQGNLTGGYGALHLGWTGRCQWKWIRNGTVMLTIYEVGIKSQNVPWRLH